MKLFNQSVKDKFSFRAIGGSLEAVGAGRGRRFRKAGRNIR